MSCEKRLRTGLNATAAVGGVWTYLGYDASSPTGSFTSTPPIPMVSQGVGDQVGTTDDPLINPENASVGFYKFRYTTTAGTPGVSTCSNSVDIIVQVSVGPCSGADTTVVLCTDQAPTSLSSLMSAAAECDNYTLGVVTGTVLNLSSYDQTTTVLNPATTALGSYTFTNTTGPIVQNGFSLGCSDCASSTSTLTVNVVRAHTVLTTANISSCHLSTQLFQSGNFITSSNPNGRWVYARGATTDASITWNGQVINVDADTPLGNQLNVPFRIDGLTIGEHFIRYYASEAPCERFEEIKITIVEPPNPGVFVDTFATLCGSSSCAPIIINDMISQEDAPDLDTTGVFSISTARVFESGESVTLQYGDSSVSSSFTYNSSNATFNSIPYGTYIRFIVDKPTLFNIIYTVNRNGCARSSIWSTTVYPASNLNQVGTNVLNFCTATTTPTGVFLFKDNFTNFLPGGQFRVFYRSNPTSGTFSQVDTDAFGLVGNPFYYPGFVRPPDNSHSLTTGIDFSNPGTRPGYYRVDYVYYGAPTNSNASQCPGCQQTTVSFNIQYANTSCGCNTRCNVGLDPLIIYSIAITPSYSSGGNTFTNFNLRTALTQLGYSLTALQCGTLPNYNLWTFYDINDYFVPLESIDFSTRNYGVYTFEFRPMQHFDAPSGAVGENLCYRSFVNLQVTTYTTAPCEISQVAITKGGGTLTASATGCSSTITYSWAGPGGFTATGATITPPRPGSYSVVASCPAVPNCTSSVATVVTCEDVNLRVVNGLVNDLSVEAFFSGYCSSPSYRWTVSLTDGSTTTTTTTSNKLTLASNTSEVIVELLCGGVPTGCFADFTCTASVNIINNGQTLTAQYNGCDGQIAGDHNLVWTAPDGSFINDLTQIVPDQVGIYTLTLVCLSTGCGGVATTTVIANCNLAVTLAAVEGNIVATPVGSCPYGNYRYNWTVLSSTGGTSLFNDVQQVPYVNGSQYTVVLTCDSGLLQNCSATAVFTCPNFVINIE
jgi:hypothetical protein